jgi:magnesium chelatase family protein
LPNFTIVDLTDRAIQEARERVRASVRNAGFEFPSRRLTVNLAPAEVPKEGTGFDLAIAMAVTCSPTAPSFAAQTGWRCQVPSWTWMSSSATRPCASR